MAISVHAKTEKLIRGYGKQRKLNPPDALDKLVSTAVGRLGALKRYADKQAKGTKTRSKKGVAKTKAKGSKKGTKNRKK